MFRPCRFALVLLLGGSVVALHADPPGGPLIHESINEQSLVVLGGNTRFEAIAANDQGAVSDSFAIEHMLLQLKRSPAAEQAVERAVAALYDPQSPSFHHWLSASEFGRQFGTSESDLRTVTTWLESHGFTVNFVYPGGMTIDFSGNAAMVREAFHTSIHNLRVNGVSHIANMSDPQIPAALAPAVAGIVALHNFAPLKKSRPHRVPPGITAHPDFTGTSEGVPVQAVVPTDLATIYDFTPLFSNGITGAGQTVAVVEDTNLYRTTDWTNFVSTFGLAQYKPTLTTVHPAPATGVTNCLNPLVNQDDDEATLDVEWSTASAPGASIVLASCADGTVTSGVQIAINNLVNGANPPNIISVSYGECEAANGAAANASLNSVYQQGAAEGISIFIAAGDEGAASCDADEFTATHGIGISAYAATQYNVAVGGTDFGDVLANAVNTYWSQTNTPTWGSAVSYIPEIPWNSSCAGSLLAGYSGFATGYGPQGFCNSIANTVLEDYFFAVAAGSGGPSNCFSGTPAVFEVASGTCAGYAKPSWQAGVEGVPSDGVRDIPDVSMFASDGVWGHYYIVCFTDPSNGGYPCTGNPGNWAGYGGTSFASPVMAGIQALINQKVGAPQGNPNPVYYQLANSATSVFHTINQGDITVNCSGNVNCYGYIGNLDFGRNGRVYNTTFGGALSLSDFSYVPAYGADGAWNFANGLGSVDADKLVTNWPTAK